MSFEGNKDEGFGKAKEAVGDATGDKDMQAEGSGQKMGGKVENFGDKVGDKISDAGDKLKD
ncbi:MAG: CsbD family protein [Candidatus Dormibacteria bacterium]